MPELFYTPHDDLYFAEHCPELQARCAAGREPRRRDRHCDECSQNDLCVQFLAHRGVRSAILWLSTHREQSPII